MQIWIYPKDGSVAVDDMHISGIDCSSIPTNIALVMWYGNDLAGHSKGGEILYNDRWSIREPFLDPSPYLGQINALMQAAAGTLAPMVTATPQGPVKTKLILRQQAQTTTPPSAASVAMSVSQAQAIQQGLVNGLFEFKRQAPVTVAGQSYNSADSDITAMSGQISAASEQVIQNINSAVQSQVNAALSSLASGVNSAFSAHATELTNKVCGNFPGPPISQASAAQANYTTIANAVAFPISLSNLNYVNVTAQTTTTPTISLTEDGPNMTWPNSAGQTQNLTFAQMCAVLKALTDRRTTLLTQKLALTASIANATSVAGVAGVNITQGW